MIKLKEGFIMREEKIYSLFRKEREEVRAKQTNKKEKKLSIN